MNNTTTTAAPAVNPNTGGKTKKAPWWPLLTILLLALSVMLLFQIKSCSEKKDEQTKRETLVLMHTCQTPCSFKLGAYPTKIRTDGDPLWIQFKGVKEWFPHPGKGAIGGPPRVEVGTATFVSRDPSDPTEGKEDSKNPHVQVWIYRVY